MVNVHRSGVCRNVNIWNPWSITTHLHFQLFLNSGNQWKYQFLCKSLFSRTALDFAGFAHLVYHAWYLLCFLANWPRLMMIYLGVGVKARRSVISFTKYQRIVHKSMFSCPTVNSLIHDTITVLLVHVEYWDYVIGMMINRKQIKYNKAGLSIQLIRIGLVWLCFCFNLDNHSV